MKLQNLELKTLAVQAQNKFGFIDKPFVLAGCNMGTVGETGKSMIKSIQF